MAIVEAAPVTDLEGGIIALAVAITCLVLRAWLTSPKRRFSRLVLLPPPPAPRSQTSAGDDRRDDLAPEGDVAFNEPAAHAVAGPRPPFADARAAYDGRH